MTYSHDNMYLHRKMSFFAMLDAEVGSLYEGTGSGYSNNMLDFLCPCLNMLGAYSVLVRHTCVCYYIGKYVRDPV